MNEKKYQELKDRYYASFETMYIHREKYNLLADEKEAEGKYLDNKSLLLLGELFFRLPLEERKIENDFELVNKFKIKGMKNYCNIVYPTKVKNRESLKAGDVYCYKIEQEEEYRFCLVASIYSTKPDVAYTYPLIYKSKDKHYPFSEVGKNEILPSMPMPVHIGEAEYVTNVKIKEEVDFVAIYPGVYENDENPPVKQYRGQGFKNLKGDIIPPEEALNMLTAYANLFGTSLSHFTFTLYTYEKLNEYIPEIMKAIYVDGEDYHNYLYEREKVTEMPEEIIKMVEETELILEEEPKEESGYQDIEIYQFEDEYILHKDYDDAIMEIVEAVEDELDGEILNGENLELVIRHYLEGKKIDMSDVSGDSDTGLISMSANDEKKMKKIIKEVNKFLKNKKKVIKYIKENKEEIEWD